MSGGHDSKGSHPPKHTEGIVTGTQDADRMLPGYTDADGDQIDGCDGNDDVILGLGGDDTIGAGRGDDLVFGGTGSDSIDGDCGNDTIYGDTGGGTASGSVRESFQWSLTPDPDGHGQIDDHDDLSGGFTQDTGSVNVTFTVLSQSPDSSTTYVDNTQNVDDIEASAYSSLASANYSDGGEAVYELDFDTSVENVSFRINDIDNDGLVRVTAFDADGNPIEVSLEAGSLLILSDTDGVPGDDTATSNGGSEPDADARYSLLVNIPGPVSRIVIEHGQDGQYDSGINVTDVYFDAPFADDGPDGDDTINGGDGDDVIYGEGGDDSVIGGEGSDTVEGGDGNDTIISGNLQPLTDLGFPGYDTIPASPADPDPNDDRDFVDGGAGDDLIFTGDDADTIFGGTGNDTLYANFDADEVDAGDGDDWVSGGEGSDTILGGAGNDTIYGGIDPLFPDSLNIENGPGGDPEEDNGRDLIDGGDGNDVIYGQDDDDTITGGAGEDLIDGGVDEDDIDGGAGSDLLTGGQGNDAVAGGDGADLALGAEGDDAVSGDAGDDILGGGAGADTVSGGAGLDVITGDAGADVLSGGDGSDLLTGGDGADVLYGDGETGEGNTAAGLFDILSGGDGDDTISGGTGSDLITGGDGADLMMGGADRDTFIGLTIGDHVDGDETGEDYDTIIVSEPAFVTYDAGNPEAGTITFVDPLTGAPLGTATFENVENVIIEPFEEGVPPAPVLLGTPGGTTPELSQAVLAVLGGSDEPPYTPGDGIVDGTNGADLIDLGYVDADGDQIDAGDAILPGQAPDDDIVLAGNGDDTVNGRLADDEIYGQNGDDVLSGDVGDDEILGGKGNDELFGDEGNDVLAGGQGDDLAQGGIGNDLIGGGKGNDTLDGGDGNDVIFGDSGDDVIRGGDGSDLLTGNGGHDQIDLGADGAIDVAFGGDDRDVFTGVGANDRIDGGEGGDDYDTLDLTGAAETANPGGSLTVDYFASNPESGVVNFFDADGNATGTMEFHNIENVVPCFTPGTAIATPKGERLVEALRAGDRIITRDNGIQEIRWCGERQLHGKELLMRNHLQPILIRAGALGNGLPERDMTVSPKHRVLVANDKTALYFEEREVLVAAKHLTGLEGVKAATVNTVTYVHFMFDQHEVVLSDGAWTESFQPGDQSLSAIGNAQRTEIFELFPELQTEVGIKSYQSARRSLRKHEAQVLFL